MRVLWVLLFTAVFAGVPCSSGARSFSGEYDGDIRHAVKTYWGDLPEWALWKAQLIQESQLDPNVCSAVGACGLSQFMPQTWDDTLRRIGADPSTSRFDARLSIEAGAYYQAKLRTSWRAEGRAGVQRNDLGLCAYNRGLGNCIKDQAECGGALLWPDIAVCTARHTEETVIYVKRINQFWKLLEGE